MGEGSRTARVMFVGEQPGDREDREGHPFVGPAGHVLDEGLQRAGIARDEVYITNVVKHFRYSSGASVASTRSPTAGTCRPACTVTTHPSAILRTRGDEERRAAMDEFVGDLAAVREHLPASPPG